MTWCLAEMPRMRVEAQQRRLKQSSRRRAETSVAVGRRSRPGIAGRSWLLTQGEISERSARSRMTGGTLRKVGRAVAIAGLEGIVALLRPVDVSCASRRISVAVCFGHLRLARGTFQLLPIVAIAHGADRSTDRL